MAEFIQIEELVYTRLPRISKSEWLKMLSKQGVANDYALLLDDYLLIEQTDYRFSNGNYISSERTVYNIDYTTYDTAENTPNPDNTEEIITVRYDSTHDRYYVYYTHFPIEDIPHTPDLSHILSEADIPLSHPFVLAPPETTGETIRPVKQPVQNPIVQPQPGATPTPAAPKKKKWRRIGELKAAYNSGKTLDQIVAQFDCTPEGAIYQLKTYCGIEHPFERKEIYKQQPTEKTLPNRTPEPAKPSVPIRRKSEKHRHRITWDGEIILAYLYDHPGSTIRDITTRYPEEELKEQLRYIKKCLKGYCANYVENDERTKTYRLNQAGVNEIRPYIESLGTPEITLDEYKSMFRNMKRAQNANGHIAPHKIVLMLAITSYYKNLMPRVMCITEHMKVLFMDYWTRYVHSEEWTPNIYMPWEHMTSEPFWHWVTDDSTKEAYIDDDLYYMIHYDKSSRIALKNYLISLLESN